MRVFLFEACIVLEFFGTIVAAIFCGVEGAIIGAMMFGITLAIDMIILDFEDLEDLEDK